jgi:hypothetical protein
MFWSPMSRCTQTSITGTNNNPRIWSFWADVNTRGTTVTAMPGEKSAELNIAQWSTTRDVASAPPEEGAIS